MTGMTRSTLASRTTARRPFRAARLTIAVATAFALAVLAGCAGGSAEQADPAPPAADASFPVTITDDASRTVTIESEPVRIVSLAPANTEILFALGLGEKVVGVTSYDDYPAEVADIAKVGDFAGPNLEAVAAADPDLILATTGVQADVIGKLEALGATVLAVDPQTLAGLYSDIGAIGEATGASDAADELVSSMQSDVSEIEQAVGSAEPVTAFVEIGQNPLFTAGAGTLLGELIELGGGDNVVKEPGYVPYSTEQLVKDDPAVYLATKGSATDPAAIEQRAGYKGLSAVENGRVVILDDNLVSRPGPRIVEGLRQIAEGLHPDAFGQ
ncbi:MAG TPA: ABC transporter substrate-binding protein [Coriobacteriia bacterium]|nr:ABC transporter substrate-binding protein [Coriobacteriia bacterium]